MDTGLNLALQQLSPALDGLMRLISLFGQEEIFIVVIGLFYWCLDRGLGARLLLLLSLSDFSNGLLKWAFHLPRPYWIDPNVRALSTEISYGLPSGHAQSSLTAYGYVAASLKKRWLWAVAAGLVLGVAVSRVYLGVHFSIDILGGWFTGAIVLIAFTQLEPRVTRWIAPKSIGVQITALVSSSLILIAVLIGVRATLDGVIDPVEWPVQAGPIDPHNANLPVSDLGLFFGASLGLMLIQRTSGFEVKGRWGKRIARLALGAFGVLVIRFGLGAIFPSEPLIPAMIFRFVRYTLMALWAVWLAPLVFVKLQLADQAEQTDRAAD
ncbi:MAG: phosphatase PAP2 family protein [Chloroflexi bacterium]|nr:phosphatase PAP2 family protein [Chloroflexota bacterium]